MFVRSDERPELEDDEVYVKDLINMKVVMQVHPVDIQCPLRADPRLDPYPWAQETGKTIGRVVDVYEGTGQYNTLRVALITADDDTSGGEEDKGLVPSSI